MIIQKVVILIFRDGDIPWSLNLKVVDDARYSFLKRQTIVFLNHANDCMAMLKCTLHLQQFEKGIPFHR